MVYYSRMHSNFAAWLNAQKEINHWENKTIAFAVGASVSTVGDWLSGKYVPDAERLAKLAEFAKEDWIKVFRIAYGLERGDTPGEMRPLETAISERLGHLNDDGLRLLLDQIDHVLMNRYKRRKGGNPGGGGEKDNGSGTSVERDHPKDRASQ